MWKILCKNIFAIYRYRDFRVGIIYFASPYFAVVIALSCIMFELFDVQNIMTSKSRLRITQDLLNVQNSMDLGIRFL